MINIFDVIKDKKTYNEKNSYAWFQQNVRQFANSTNITPYNVLGANVDKQSRQIYPGQMIMYYYAAKTRKKLPYWDKFPLVMPFSADAKYFYGINLHYLPPRYRMDLLNRLMQVKGNLKDRINLSWEILNNASKYPEVQPCVKRYLHGYVKTYFFIVPQEDWPIAIHLPLEKFTGATAEQVWADSQRKIGRRI